MQEKIHNLLHTHDILDKGEQLAESVKETLGSAVNSTRDYAESLFSIGSPLGFFFSLLLALSTILLVQYIYHLITCQRTRSRQVPIVKRDWKPDVVYLFQFPRTKFVPNTSPFCLKLETFLRHHNIRYEVLETMTLRSVEGKLPFIELNGVHYQDSQLIICHLIKHFGLEAYDGLSEEQKGHVRAVSRMLDHGTFYQLLYFKLGKNLTKFYDITLADHAPRFLKWLLFPIVYPRVWDKLNLEGTGFHSDAEVEAILRADLKALNAMLGDRLWLIGDQATLADFTFFGHIAAIYNLPYPLPIQQMLVEEFPRLRALHDRMARHYFAEFNFGRMGPRETQVEKLPNSLTKILE